MRIPAALLERFPASRDRLLERARQGVDDEMLVTISRADYGIGASEVLERFAAIRDRGVVPIHLRGQLREVLELIRFSDPERPDPPPFEPGPSGERGHQERFFACAVLLSAECDPLTADDSALANGLASAAKMDDTATEAMARFLTCRCSHWEMDVGGDPTNVICLLALLVAVVRLHPLASVALLINETALWILEEDSRASGEFPLDLHNPRPHPLSLQQGFWRSMVQELEHAALAIAAPAIRENVQLCATLIQ